MKKKPVKPTPKTRAAYDYMECRDYIDAKYGITQDDYAGAHRSIRATLSKPYQNFWHWVVDKHSIHNGCYLTFSPLEEDTAIEDWQRHIYELYLKEFGDENGEVTFWVEW